VVAARKITAGYDLCLGQFRLQERMIDRFGKLGSRYGFTIQTWYHATISIKRGLEAYPYCAKLFLGYYTHEKTG